MALKGRKTAIVLTGAILALIVVAWIDGGEEPVRAIEQPVELPESAL